MSESNSRSALRDLLRDRFGSDVPIPDDLPGLDELLRIAGHRTYRVYEDRPVAPDLVALLMACALSAPSKSDLQQADIIEVRDPDRHAALAALVPTIPWVAEAPVLLVFCGNSARIRKLSDLRGKVFANDHLDAFMNAAVDAGIVLTTFLRAATAVGLGCCPVSVLRDQSQRVSEILALPDWVFPVAGLTLGYPGQERNISPRLPLALTTHRDRYDEGDFAAAIDGYDRRRHAFQPMGAQRQPELYGEAPFYGWSEDKARQYAVSQRADFGAFLRGKGFKLD